MIAPQVRYTPTKARWALDAKQFRITTLTDAPSPGCRQALKGLLLEYYAVIVEKLDEAGFPTRYTLEQFMSSIWQRLPQLLSPARRLFLVEDSAERIVGCGTLHQIRPDAGEVKRHCVRPEAARHGLGRAVVDAWIDTAREIGFGTLLVNVIKTNRAPSQIIQSLGFKNVDRHPECADPIKFDPYFAYLQNEVT